VIALFKAFDFITARSRRFSRVTNPRPTLIVKDGQYIEDD
jgi:uncharacterized membrane protein YcaP (DUF421 family)